MTVLIEISGQLEEALKAQASVQGLSTDAVARQVLVEALTAKLCKADTTPASGVLSGEEKARAFVEWAESHRYTPPLSEEAVSRASMYPDR